MRRVTLAILIALPAAAAGGVDPSLMVLVPPAAKMLAGGRIDQRQATPFERYLESQIQLDQETRKLMDAAGFDPARDVQEILASSVDFQNDALLSGRGAFHPARIAAAATARGAAVSTYRGVTLIEGKRGSIQSGAIAFLDESTVVAGTANTVRAAIDRRAAHASFSGPIADKARQLGASNDAWLVWVPPATGVTSGASNEQLGPLGNILRSAVQLAAGLKLDATKVTLSADVLTRTPQDAQAMADVLRFAIGMLQANQSQGKGSSGAQSIASAAQISANGSVAHVTLSLPEQQVEQMFLPSSAPPKKVAVR